MVREPFLLMCAVFHFDRCSAVLETYWYSGTVYDVLKAVPGTGKLHREDLSGFSVGLVLYLYQVLYLVLLQSHYWACLYQFVPVR